MTEWWELEEALRLPLYTHDLDFSPTISLVLKEKVNTQKNQVYAGLTRGRRGLLEYIFFQHSHYTELLVFIWDTVIEAKKNRIWIALPINLQIRSKFKC